MFGKNKEEKRIKKEIYKTIDLIAKEAGEKIRRKDYPRIIYKDFERDSNLGSYVPLLNVMIISPKIKDPLFLQDTIAEEAGHFVREYILRKQGLRSQGKLNKALPEPELGEGFAKRMMEYFRKRESKGFKKSYVDEFFGYLARNIVRQKKNLPLLEQGREVLKKDVRELRELRKQRASLQRYLEDEEKEGFPLFKNIYKDFATMDKVFEIKDFGKYLEGRRKDILAHSRPYRFASQINPRKIDLKKLYHMPDEEVIKRFFKEDKDLSGLEKTIIGVSAGFILSSFLIYHNITGNTILNPLSKQTGQTLFLTGLVGLLGFVLYKIIKK